MNIIKKISDKPYLHTLYSKVLYAALTFIANAIVARALGVELKGDYTWVINMANLVAIVAGLGIYQSIPFFKRQDGDNTDIVQEYVNIFIFQFLIYVLIASGVIFFFKGEELITLVCVLALVDVYSQELNMLMLVDNIFMKNKIFIWGSYLNFGCSVLCYVFFKDNLAIAVGILVLVKVFYIIGYLLSMKKKPHPFGTSVSSICSKIKFGYLPMLSFLLVTFNYKIDVLMLKANSNVSKAELGYYAVGVSIAELAWFIPDVFKEVLFFKTAQKNNYKEVSAVLRVSNMVMVVVILGIIITIRPLIWVCYGKAFMPSWKVTILLFLGIPAMSWFKIINTLFTAQGRRKLTFVMLSISAAINVITNAITIPIIGIYGAAVASVLSYSVCGIVFVIIYARVSGEKIYNLFILKRGDIRSIVKNKIGKED